MELSIGTQLLYGYMYGIRREYVTLIFNLKTNLYIYLVTKSVYFSANKMEIVENSKRTQVIKPKEIVDSDTVTNGFQNGFPRYISFLYENVRNKRYPK